jgi:glycosyltransferase involved in cell wall biosynthesis
LKPVNVLYLDASRGLYGASRMLLTLLRGLDRGKFNPQVILANDIANEEALFPPELQKLQIPYREKSLCVLRRTKYLNPRGLVWLTGTLTDSVPWLVNLIRDRNIGLIHTNTSTILSGALAAALTRTPHVWSVHEVLRWEGMLLSPLLHSLSTRVTAISEAVAASLWQRFPWIKTKIVVIPNGIDPGRITDLPPGAAKNLRQELGISPDAPVVSMVGRIGSWKGEYLFLEMAREVAGQFPQVKFLIVGGVFDGKYQHLEDLKREVSRAGLDQQVIVTGYRTDIPAIISATDVLVLPSVQPEPFGLVLLEAMAAGKPVIATDLGGPREIVQNGVTGFLVDYNQATEMAGRVRQLLANESLRRRMGLSGLARVKSQFSQQRYVEAYQRLYEEILAAA